MGEFIGTPADAVVITVYFIGILAFGSFFARYTRTTTDFFFAGRRFSWWLVAFSGVATVVGSYSFIKYSEAAYTYGFAATQTYTNDWMWMPLLVFGWIPIVYYNRIRSIPEYFDRRFGTAVHVLYTGLLLLYMLGYVGINLYTLGKAVNAMMPTVEVVHAAVAVACFTAIYVTAGGQSSVIMTDLAQSILLLGAGFVIFIGGLYHIGGLGTFWDAVPSGYRHSLGEFAGKSKLSFVKIFWQDGMANTFAFYFVNQGMVLRFLSAKSASEARKAVLFNVLVLMPIAAFAVCNAGLVGRAMTTLGILPEDTEGGKIFVLVSQMVTAPGLFGLIMAALVAALMSTADTLVNGMSAIAINDIWRPYLLPRRTDRFYLNLARVHCVAIMGIGLALVPVYMTFQTIYDAHGAFTAAVTPPLVTSLLLAILWPRFNQTGALLVLTLGTALVGLSLFIPQLIQPFAHGIPLDLEDGQAPYKAYKYMRACYGLLVCLGIGVAGTWLTSCRKETSSLLCVGPALELMRFFKGSEPNLEEADPIVLFGEVDRSADSDQGVCLPAGAAAKLRAKKGDLLYISDTRRWLGGLKSVHAHIGKTDASCEKILLPEELVNQGRFDLSRPVRVEKMM